MSKEFKSFFKNVGGGKVNGATTRYVLIHTDAVALTTASIATRKAFLTSASCGTRLTLPLPTRGRF